MAHVNASALLYSLSMNMHLGLQFVAISRLPHLSCGLIMPMPFQRLQSISCGRNFLSRIQEQTRLQQLSDSQ